MTVQDQAGFLSFGNTAGAVIPLVLILDGTPGLSPADQQQLVGGYPGQPFVGAGGTLEWVLDLNTRLAVYLRDFYEEPAGDLTTLVDRYLDLELHDPDEDYNERFHHLIDDATASMQP